MAIRLRVVDGKRIVVCAACTVEKPGDVYLGDEWHGPLADKFSRDFNEMFTSGLSFDEDAARLVEAEESNNPAREWWDKTYGDNGNKKPAGHITALASSTRAAGGETVMTITETRKLYEPYWKANGAVVSDPAVELVSQLSLESLEGFEGADFIGLTPLIEKALIAARAAGIREAAAEERITALETLVSRAGPLAWVANQDMDGAREWEVAARALLTPPPRPKEQS